MLSYGVTVKCWYSTKEETVRKLCCIFPIGYSVVGTRLYKARYGLVPPCPGFPCAFSVSGFKEVPASVAFSPGAFREWPSWHI